MEALVRLLLLVYPRSFRQQFRPEMLQFLRECRRETPKISPAAWLRLFIDVLAAAVGERWTELREVQWLPRLCTTLLSGLTSISLLLTSHFDPHWLTLPAPPPPLMSPSAALRDLADPTIAFVLLVAGLYGLLLELSAPGTWIPGVLGLTCAVAGSASLAALPVNYAGLALVLVSVLVLLAGVKVPAHGVLAGMGFVLFVLGSLMLFNLGDGGLRISEPVVAAVSLATTMFFGLLARLGAAVRRLPAAYGAAELVGLIGEARTAVRTHGQVLVRGERWRATCDRIVPAGERVQVVSVNGLTLTVRPVGRV